MPPIPAKRSLALLATTSRTGMTGKNARKALLACLGKGILLEKQTAPLPGVSDALGLDL